MQIISSKAHKALQEGANIRLNLGAGDSVRPEFLSVDIRRLRSTDIIADLNEELSLIPDNSVIEVYSRHTLEHIDNLDLLLSEIVRICVPDARITIVVPHFSNTFGYSDPTHRRFFGIYSFCYYSQTPYFGNHRLLPIYNPSIEFDLKKIELRFYRVSWVDRVVNPFLERLINKKPSIMAFYERRFSYLWPAWEIEYQLTLP